LSFNIVDGAVLMRQNISVPADKPKQVWQATVSGVQKLKLSPKLAIMKSKHIPRCKASGIECEFLKALDAHNLCIEGIDKASINTINAIMAGAP
jgi:hypothetical protein